LGFSCAKAKKNKSIGVINEEAIERWKTGDQTIEDFNLGDDVKIIVSCEDMTFFNGERGKIIRILENQKYSIVVEFCKPRHFTTHQDSTWIQNEFCFRPICLLIWHKFVTIYEEEMHALWIGK
jgi:hypothetical protein